MKEKRKKFKYDPWIFYPYLFLSLLGILMVYSASANVTLDDKYAASPIDYLIRQTGYFLVGLFLIFIFAHLKFSFLKQGRVTNSYILLVVILLLFLIIQKVIYPQRVINGASAWIKMGPINLQPSEFAKLGIILYLARMLAKREKKLTWKTMKKSIMGPLLFSFFIMSLVLLQPDTGGALSLFLITLMVVSISGIPWYIGAGSVILIVTVLSGIISFIAHLYTKGALGKIPYQVLRVIAFVDPWKNSGSAGIQLTNSYFAINNGGWLGVGIGNSIQKHGYLPEANTDFILAIIAEEMGVVTVILILIAIFMIITRAVILGIRSKNNYYAMLCIGVATTFFTQTVFNVGGVAGLLPITGVTLPFISYGGSSILLLSMELGLLFHISNEDHQRRIEAKIISND